MNHDRYCSILKRNPTDVSESRSIRYIDDADRGFHTSSDVSPRTARVGSRTFSEQSRTFNGGKFESVPSLYVLQFEMTYEISSTVDSSVSTEIRRYLAVLQTQKPRRDMK